MTADPDPARSFYADSDLCSTIIYSTLHTLNDNCLKRGIIKQSYRIRMILLSCESGSRNQIYADWKHCLQWLYEYITKYYRTCLLTEQNVIALYFIKSLFNSFILYQFTFLSLVRYIHSIPPHLVSIHQLMHPPHSFRYGTGIHSFIN
jgi:hypothetical protein